MHYGAAIAIRQLPNPKTSCNQSESRWSKNPVFVFATHKARKTLREIVCASVFFFFRCACVSPHQMYRSSVLHHLFRRAKYYKWTGSHNGNKLLNVCNHLAIIYSVYGDKKNKNGASWTLLVFQLTLKNYPQLIPHSCDSSADVENVLCNTKNHPATDSVKSTRNHWFALKVERTNELCVFQPLARIDCILIRCYCS